MNILEEIQNCPVEWKELWEVTIWDKNFNSVPTYKQLETDKYEYRLAKELSQMVSENGDVKILTTSPSDLWTSEYIASWEFYEKEIIAIPWGGNPVVQYYKGKFITGDNRIARVKNSSELSTKFLFSCLPFLTEHTSPNSFHSTEQFWISSRMFISYLLPWLDFQCF